MNKLYLHKHIKIADNSVFTDGILTFATQADEAFSTFIKSVYKDLGIDYGKFYKMDLLSKLGFIAAELALADIDLTGITPEQIAIIAANASASLNTDKKYYESIEELPSPSVFVYTLPNIVIGEICIRHNIKGENLFLVQDEFDSKLILNYIKGLFNEGPTRLCLTGWIELDMVGNYKADLYLVSQTTTAIEFNESIFK